MAGFAGSIVVVGEPVFWHRDGDECAGVGVGGGESGPVAPHGDGDAGDEQRECCENCWDAGWPGSDGVGVVFELVGARFGWFGVVDGVRECGMAGGVLGAFLVDGESVFLPGWRHDGASERRAEQVVGSPVWDHDIHRCGGDGGHDGDGDAGWGGCARVVVRVSRVMVA